MNEADRRENELPEDFDEQWEREQGYRDYLEDKADRDYDSMYIDIDD